MSEQMSFGVELSPADVRVLEAVRDGLDYRFSLMAACGLYADELEASLNRLRNGGLVKFDERKVVST